MHYPSDVEWNDLIVVTISDASWAGKSDERGNPYYSQGGRLIRLCEPTVLTTGRGKLVVLGWSSTKLKRVCRRTLQAETQGMVESEEEGTRMRALIVDYCGWLPRKEWEASARSSMQHLWITDCCSLRDNLKNPVSTKASDKRLSVDLMAFRQHLLNNLDGSWIDELSLKDCDVIAWTGTTAIVVDPLTKAMDPGVLGHAVTKGSLELIYSFKSERKASNMNTEG